MYSVGIVHDMVICTWHLLFNVLDGGMMIYQVDGIDDTPFFMFI